MEMNKFSVEMKCYIILSDLISSYNFWVMSPRNSASFTRPVSRREARAGWARGPTSASMCLVKQFTYLNELMGCFCLAQCGYELPQLCYKHMQ